MRNKGWLVAQESSHEEGTYLIMLTQATFSCPLLVVVTSREGHDQSNAMAEI